MPELPEVETVRRGLEPAMAGRRIVAVEQRRPDLRRPLPPDFTGRLTGRVVERIDRRAKYLLGMLSDELVLIMHLGMTGRFVVEDGERRITPGDFYDASPRHEAHDHVVFDLEGGMRVIYNDVRRFGLMDLSAAKVLGAHPLMAGLGVEPLGEDFSGAFLARAFKDRETSLKAALLDQRIVAGLGNIYVCEALHRAGLSPQRAAGSLAPSGRSTARTERLASEIRAVLNEALLAGGSTLRDYVQADGTRGAFQEDFRVYDRTNDPCRRRGCRGVVERLVQSGRSTFWCPECQK